MNGGLKKPFKMLYMVGDNPAVDIKGAQQVCSGYLPIILLM